MTTEITKKQAILLAVLGVILVLIIYVQLLIRPTLTTISETKEQIETLEQQYESLVQQGASYDQNVQALESWRETNSEETTKLYPLCSTNRIDRFLNFVIRECGAEITSLSISDTLEYFIDGEGNLVLADPDTVDTTLETADSEETTGYTATGEYRCDFTYSMEGNYEDMVQILRFVDGLSFLGISSYTFNSIDAPISETSTDDASNTAESSEEDPGADDWYSFTMTINAYMYEDPIADDTEEETDAEEEESTETTENT